MTDEQLIREARNEYMRRWRAENPDRYRAYQKLWRMNNQAKKKAADDAYWLRRGRELLSKDC